MNEILTIDIQNKWGWFWDIFDYVQKSLLLFYLKSMSIKLSNIDPLILFEFIYLDAQ